MANESLLRAAGLGGPQLNWSFDSFPDRIRETKVYQAVKKWAAPKKPKRHGIILCGRPGTGKTGLAVSCVREWAMARRGSSLRWHIAEKAGDGRFVAPVWFEPWSVTHHKFVESSFAGGVDRLSLLTNCQLLALDDLDMGNPTAYREEMLRMLVERPYYEKRLILTMNREPTGAVDILGERIVDRLLDRSVYAVLYCDWPSLRTGA